jgi:hypothetical protein
MKQSALVWSLMAGWTSNGLDLSNSAALESLANELAEFSQLDWCECIPA